MRIAFSGSTAVRSGALVVGVLDDGVLTPAAQRIDQSTDGAIGRALKSSRFKGQKGQSLAIVAPSGVKASRILLVGLGKGEEFDDLAAQNLGGSIVAAVGPTGETTATVAVDAIKGAKLKAAEIAANVAYGALLRSYRFDKYRTKQKPEQKPSLQTLTVATKDEAEAKRLYGPKSKVAEGVFFTRDLVSEPANVIYR